MINGYTIYKPFCLFAEVGLKNFGISDLEAAKKPGCFRNIPNCQKEFVVFMLKLDD